MSAALHAYVFKDASIIIDGIEYANQCSKARLVPSQQVQTYPTLVPDGAVQDVDAAVWTLELGGLQINHPNGLAAALRAAAIIGDTIDVTIVPKIGSGMPKATADVTPMHPPFGGDRGAFLELGDMTLPVTGQPVFGTTA